MNAGKPFRGSEQVTEVLGEVWGLVDLNQVIIYTTSFSSY